MNPDDQLALMIGRLQLTLLQADLKVQELTNEVNRLNAQLEDIHGNGSPSTSAS